MQSLVLMPALKRILLCAVLFFICALTSSMGVAAENNTADKGRKIYPTYPKPVLAPGSDQKLIERGEYLTKAGDCIACHTEDKPGAKPFAGGLPINTPFGTFYTPNITGDKETGIGKWSDDDFLRAMRKGINPHGKYYYPVFPYPSFTKISPEDTLAIKAYLMSIPPVKQQNRENDVMFPFGWRFLQLGWRILFFHEAEYQHDANQSTEWNRGAYLVQGLGHCGMCHSPLNLLGAEKKDYYLTGGFVDGYYAPNITSTGLKNASIHDVVNVFRKGQMLNGAGQVQGPMAEVNNDSLQYLTDADLTAMATYLKTVKSKEIKASGGKITASTGKKIYEAHCAVCHNSGAAGAPIKGNAVDWEPRIKQGMDLLNLHAINGLNSMPPKGTCLSCSDDEIKAAVQYLVDQVKDGSGTASKSAVPQRPKLTLADGKKIYQENCSVCHKNGALGAPVVGDKKAWEPLIAQGMDVLFTNTIKGYNRMPAKGACTSCTNAELQAAVKYMVEESKSQGDYSLW